MYVEQPQRRQGISDKSDIKMCQADFDYIGGKHKDTLDVGAYGVDSSTVGEKKDKDMKIVQS